MLDPDNGVSGGLHDDVQIGAEQLLRIRNDCGTAVLEGRSDICDYLILRPFDQLEGAFRPPDVDVGNADNVNTWNVSRLGQIHRPVTARADQTDPDGSPLLFAILEQVME